MKKGIICAALALMVVLSMTGVVAAADPTQAVPATYAGDEETFTWVIPSEVTVNANGATSPATFGVGLSAVAISLENRVKITIASTNFGDSSFRVNQGGASGEYLKYAISQGESPLTPASSGDDANKIVVYYDSVKTDNDYKAVLDASATAAHKGAYKDTLTFTGTIVPKSA